MDEAGVDGKRIGLALGGGGAKGLAHVPILETLDDMGLRPSMIAGTSIGAVIGALYAGGLGGRVTRQEVERVLFGDETEPDKRFSIRTSFMKLMQVLDVDLNLSSGGLLGAEGFLDRLYEDLPALNIEELAIPLKVVVTDFWSREQVVLDSGSLRDAVQASMALPVLFAPVVIDGRVLVDGGSVNPVPYDLLFDDCDVVIAVDVTGSRVPDTADPRPSLMDSVFNTFQIMMQSIVAEKRRRREPDLYLRPDILDVQMLEFDRAEEIYRSAEPACREIREKLPALLA